MMRVMAISLAAAMVSLALGGCPSPQGDPQPGVVSVLTPGSYSGTLACGGVDDQGVETEMDPITGKVLITEEGGLRLYADNIAPNETLSQTIGQVTIEETIGQITETADTVTIPTTGSITAPDGKILTERTVTLKQTDPTHIEMTEQSKNTNESTDEVITTTCTGTVSQ